MTKKKTEPLIRDSCTFRVFIPLCIRASGDWIPGTKEAPVIADLSDVADEMIRWLLERGSIETADGEPINKASGKRGEDRPCPCNK